MVKVFGFWKYSGHFPYVLGAEGIMTDEGFVPDGYGGMYIVYPEIRIMALGKGREIKAALRELEYSYRDSIVKVNKLFQSQVDGIISL